MFTGFLIAITIVCFLLILAIMVQNPKGGGLSSTFGAGAGQLGGVQKTTDFLDKSTWTLAGVLLALILLSSLSFGSSSTDSKVLGTDDVTIPAVQTPAAPEANTATGQTTDNAATTSEATEEAAK
ncbi:preprotein translocase subunit SecG [Flavobacterium haoranii]|uniref:Protein-export membrane protein SecG n=1 Tax=Flavobacterium haoranii TaxID=683124 RepID=A0A1M6J9K8_9FLAO|nr:preprotein translocase subunit SecG [Flavobacterium haoranii]SHJ43416.1 preprotein translocase subunit SecG [Flavobacterium haoranii]